MSYDNACKYLAEQYPVEFVNWLLAVESQDIERIQGLSIEQLESLGEALLDFSQEADLVAWLEK